MIAGNLSFNGETDRSFKLMEMHYRLRVRNGLDLKPCLRVALLKRNNFELIVFFTVYYCTYVHTVCLSCLRRFFFYSSLGCSDEHSLKTCMIFEQES
jgi:hypothetical protein